MAIKVRSIRNIHFTNCRFEKNGSDGLVIGNDYFVDGDGTITEAYVNDNISLTNCSFNNPGVNIWLGATTITEKPPEFGGATNFRVIGCSFRQEPVPNKSNDVPSMNIRMAGSGCILGCDFVNHNVVGFTKSQIIFDESLSNMTWRVIGNHFKASPNKVFAIEINGSNPKISIIGNHFESVTDNNPPPDVVKHPFVLLQNSDPSSHVFHSNIGDGQIYSIIDTPIGKSYRWIDVSPGIPVTLGSAFTKKRNEKVTTGLTSKIIDFSTDTDLNPPVPGAGTTPTQVDYQVNVSFQWDAGNWWISNKGKDQFTLNWANPAPTDAKLDWTLHL
jgi:hypothetical protein